MSSPSEKSNRLTLRIFPNAPGFSLPSMSPECLATIVYLKYISQQSSIQWNQVNDSESLEARNLDPVLNCTCGEDVVGLTSIFYHLQTCSSLGGTGSLDDWMNENEKADCEAWMSLALSTGKEMTDLYLYVTSSNYIYTTRPAYSAIFPLHVNYMVPPAHRKLAISRTEHSGLEKILKSSEDDDDEDKSVKVQTNSISANLPDRLNIGRRKNELSASQRKIRLEKLITRTVGPFAELLGEKKFIMSEDRPCSLDATLLGFYGLILDVKMTDQWASNIIRQKYPSFTKWVEKNSRDVFS